MGPAVLVVDDEPAICDNLAAFLEDEGMRVHRAQSGEEAVQLIAGGLAVAVCIMDLRLPGMKGSEAIRDIRRLAPRVRFIVHTGTAPEAVGAELRTVGLSGTRVFNKPVQDMASLAQAVRELIGDA